MGDIDCLTKRKAPNAYALFTTYFVEDYKARHGQASRRFQGGLARAINDDLVRQAWESLTDEERQMWKDRARREKNRMNTEYAHHLQQYVSAIAIGPGNETGNSPIAVRAEVNQRSSSVEGFCGIGEGGEIQPTWQGETNSARDSRSMESSLRMQSAANLKRLLRPQKRKKTQEESKYAPAYLKEISTAKQFQEKRRRERECLPSIWIWRFADNKANLRNEPFFFISSQSAGVEGDVRLPGTLACVEFTVRDGVRRELACSIVEGFPDWRNSSGPRSSDVDCFRPRLPADICRELFGDWLRTTHRDLSSKTPVFYCLVDEYRETLDCLTQIYGYKDGSSSTRFSPYLLATLDDLVWCILQFLGVPLVLNNVDGGSTDQSMDQSARSRPLHEMFALSLFIELQIDELSKRYSCASHRKQPERNAGSDWTSLQDAAVGCGDALPVENQQRCPLAVLRACVMYAKNWVESGHVDSAVFMQPAVETGGAHEKKTKNEENEKRTMTSIVESMKSEDIDRISCLALTASVSGDSDKTLNSGSGNGGRVSGLELDNGSEESEDIVELQPNQQHDEVEPELGTTNTVDYAPTISSISVGPLSSICCSTASEAEHLLKSGKGRGSLFKQSSARVPITDAPGVLSAPQPMPMPMPMPPISPKIGGLSLMQPMNCWSYWTTAFHIEYDAQLRLPVGFRGLGRGMLLNIGDLCNDGFDDY